MKSPRFALPFLPARRTRGFTLIELLTVITLIAILAALTLAGIGRMRQSAQRSVCLSNLRQIQEANLLHAADNHGKFIQINKNGQWWIVQEELTRYLNADKKTSEAHSMADELKCPTASHTFLDNSTNKWEKENFPGYGYYKYGATSSSGGFTALSQFNVTKPAQIMAFADALDFWFYNTPSSSYKWDSEKKTGTTISYRHNNGSCIAYFDGHVQYLRRDQIEPKSAHKDLWGNNN